jgi:hypothetical protein
MGFDQAVASAAAGVFSLARLYQLTLIEAQREIDVVIDEEKLRTLVPDCAQIQQYSSESSAIGRYHSQRSSAA